MTLTTLSLYCLALAAGALIPVQASSNALLTLSTGHILYSSLILFAIGFAMVLGLTLILKPEMPGLQTLLDAPLQSYLGGLIVASYVLSITFLVPRIGVGNAVLFIVSGQIISAALIDHFGLFGTPIFELNTKRILGLGCMVFGLTLARQ